MKLRFFERLVVLKNRELNFIDQELFQMKLLLKRFAFNLILN